MAWHLGLAIGGIKLQVMKEDIEQALSVLNEIEDHRGAAGEDSAKVAADEKSKNVHDHCDEEHSMAETDELVARALRCAAFGLLLFPLQFYSIWLLGRIAVMAEDLSRSNRRRCIIAVLLDLYVVFLFLTLVHFSCE
jgi:hypothetical protein